MQALILAGGEGTRLRPLTSTVPKPVLPLANRPFISYMVDWLEAHGIDDIVMSCGFLAEQVRAVLGDGAGDGPRIRYVEERTPLGTAGAVKHGEGLLEDRFAVLNGDILADFDLTALQRFHAERGAVATIALTPVEDPSAYGLVRTTDRGEIEAFVEKPAPDEIDTNLINAGAYVLERSVLDRIEPGRPTSFEREVFPSLIGAGLYGWPAEGYWIDIGTPERYLEATSDILAGRVRTVLDRALGEERLDIGSGSRVAAGASVSPPALIGRDCEIAPDARVGPDVVLGHGCTVASGAVVEHAVLHDGVRLERGAAVRRSIVGSDAHIGAGAAIEDEAVVGAGAAIDAKAAVAGERVDG